MPPVFLSCLVLSGFVLLVSPAYPQMAQIEREIADFDRQIQQNRELAQVKEKSRGSLNDEINKTQAAISELERQLGPLTAGIEALKLNTENAKILLEAAFGSPELVDSQKLEALHKAHRAAWVNQAQKENEAALLSKELDGYRKNADDLKGQKRALELEMDILDRGVRSLALKKPVIVESIGECVMHEDISPKACEEQAMLEAKQHAIEIGGANLVQSLTKLSISDIVRAGPSAKTLAKIRHMEIIQAPTLLAQGELGKYVVKIRAAVQSLMPEVQAVYHKPVGGDQIVTGSMADSATSEDSSKPKNLEESLGHSPPRILASTAFNLAYNDYLMGNYDLAIAGFQQFVKDFSESSLTPNAHYWLGELYFQQGDYRRAIQMFEYVSREFSGNETVPASIFKLGLAAGETGDLVKAEKNLRRVIEEFPTSDEAHLAKNKLAEIR